MIIAEDEITVWACCILPEHAHLVAARHRHTIERIVNLFKGAATRQLLAEELHPLAQFRDANGDVPKCWARGEGKIFLNTEADIRRSITYAEDNPLKEGKPRQQWGFITPFEGLH
jgi:REP element-mobilizing transposase RayT